MKRLIVTLVLLSSCLLSGCLSLSYDRNATSEDRHHMRYQDGREPRNDRDGDGVPNKYDHYPDNPYHG